MQCLHVLVVICFTSLTLTIGSLVRVVNAGDGDNLLLAAVKPPERPGNFKNLNQLNKYLDELKQYYTIIGRPRFGKRSSTNWYDGDYETDFSPDDKEDNFIGSKSWISENSKKRYSSDNMGAFSKLLLRLLSKEPKVVVVSSPDHPDLYEN